MVDDSAVLFHYQCQFKKYSIIFYSSVIIISLGSSIMAGQILGALLGDHSLLRVMIMMLLLMSLVSLKPLLFVKIIVHFMFHVHHLCHEGTGFLHIQSTGFLHIQS